MNHKPAPLEAEIRRAILADSFSEAQVLVQQYLDAVEATLRRDGIDGSGSAELRNQTLAFLDWANMMVRVSRADLDAALSNLRTVHRYDIHPLAPTVSAQA